MSVIHNIRIQDGVILLDGQELHRFEEQEINSLAKAIYRKYSIYYAKFFKMSALCKLGFLASEILLQQDEWVGVDPDRVSLVFANASSSLHSDIIYLESVNSKPSPALFVYTLPNILIGEICIRNSFKGEGLFFIEEAYNKSFVQEYAEILLETGKSSMCLAGWVDVDLDGNYLADLDMLK